MPMAETPAGQVVVALATYCTCIATVELFFGAETVTVAEAKDPRVSAASKTHFRMKSPGKWCERTLVTGFWDQVSLDSTVKMVIRSTNLTRNVNQRFYDCGFCREGSEVDMRQALCLRDLDASLTGHSELVASHIA